MITQITTINKLRKELISLDTESNTFNADCKKIRGLMDGCYLHTRLKKLYKERAIIARPRHLEPEVLDRLTKINAILDRLHERKFKIER